MVPSPMIMLRTQSSRIVNGQKVTGNGITGSKGFMPSQSTVVVYGRLENSSGEIARLMQI